MDAQKQATGKTTYDTKFSNKILSSPKTKEIVSDFKSQMGKLNFKTSFSTGVSVTAGIIANLYVLFLQAGSLTNLATLSGWKVGIGVAAIGIIGTAIYRAIKVRKLSLGLAKDLQTEAMDNL